VKHTNQQTLLRVDFRLLTAAAGQPAQLALNTSSTAHQQLVQDWPTQHISPALLDELDDGGLFYFGLFTLKHAATRLLIRLV